MQFEAVKNEAGLNRFVMTPTKWIAKIKLLDFADDDCVSRSNHCFLFLKENSKII